MKTGFLLLLLTAFLILPALLPPPPLAGEEKSSWEDYLAEAEERAPSDKPAAFSLYEKAFRACPSDSSRFRIIRRAFSLSPCDPPPLSEAEKTEAEKHMLSLRVACLRNALSSFSPQGRIAVLKKIAEIAPSYASWADERIRAISHSLIESLTPDEKAELERLVENVTPSKLDDLARRFKKQGNYRMAIRLYWAYIMNKKTLTEEERSKIIAKVLELTKKLTEEISAEERKKLDDLFSSPMMTELTVRPSMKFFFIGSKDVLRRIKDKDIRAFDAAYILISDLYSNDPAANVRLPVVLNPFSTSRIYPSGAGFLVGRACFPADGKLPLHHYYIALDRKLGLPSLPYEFLYSGRREIASVYCRYMLGTPRRALREAEKMAAAFRRFYSERDIPFHLMPPYDVAAGFFLAVPLKYGKLRNGEFSWLKYREVWEIIISLSRALYPRYRFPVFYAYACAKVYGRKVYRDFAAMRLPVTEESFNDFAMEAFSLYPEYLEARDEYRARRYVTATEKFWNIVRDYPPCPLVNDAYRFLMHCYSAMRKGEAADKIRKRLGIITRWMTIAPFSPRGFESVPTALAAVLPPEIEVNYSASYPSAKQVARWKAVSANLDGRFVIKYSYPRYTVAYALVYLKVPEETEAYLYFAANAYYRIWINGRLSASQMSRRSAWRFDEDRYPVRLDKGVNRLLVKFYNVTSGAIYGGGRIVSAQGLPIPFLEQTVSCLEKDVPRPLPPDLGDPIFDEGKAGDRGWYSRWRVTAGSFVSRKNVIYPQSAQPAGKWFRFAKYTPYFTGPANMAWLKPSYLRRRKVANVSFELTAGTADHPMFLLTFDGEGEDDPLSGISLGVARFYRWRPIFFGLFRYDMPLSIFPLAELPRTRKWKWNVTRKDGWLWVEMNGKKMPIVFHAPPVSPAARDGYPFGMSSWGRGIGISGLVFRRAK